MGTGWEGELGEEWLISASRYGVGRLSSGEVFWCSSEPATADARHAWIERLGEPVVAGANVPERPADPADLAAIDAAEAQWTAAALDSYTFAVRVASRYRFADAGNEYRCGMGTVRVVVSDGEVVQARDLSEGCDVAPDDAPTLRGLFDLARANAGALDAIAFDAEYGYVSDFYANDRSVELAIYVDEFVEFGAPLDVGDRQTALDEAQARWEASGVGDYTATVEVRCYCTNAGTFEIAVEDGSVDVVAVDTPQGLPIDEVDLTIDGLFATLTEHLDDESVQWAFHPELGYPAAARMTSEALTAHAELDLFVTDLTIAD